MVEQETFNLKAVGSSPTGPTSPDIPILHTVLCIDCMYSLTKAEYTQLKRKLTIAKNSKNPDKIIEACAEAFNVFDDRGYPDNWHNWERARLDAEAEKRRW